MGNADKKDDGATAGAVPIVSKQSWTVAPGDERYVFFAGIVKPLNCGSKERARLIAAAPAMLEALKAMKLRLGCSSYRLGEDLGQMIDAAITAATKG